MSAPVVWVSTRRGGMLLPVYHKQQNCCVGRGTPLRIPTLQTEATKLGLMACSRCAGGLRGGE